MLSVCGAMTGIMRKRSFYCDSGKVQKECEHLGLVFSECFGCIVVTTERSSVVGQPLMTMAQSKAHVTGPSSK